MRATDLRQLLTTFLPVFVFFALLPFALGASFRYIGRADASIPLRIWLEPTTISSSIGFPITVSVMASYDSDSQTLANLSVHLVTDPSINPSQSVLVYPQAFSGKVRLGQVTLTPTKIGTFTITIPENQVLTTRRTATATSPLTLTIK